MTSRIHHPQIYRRLKTATARVLKDHGGGGAAARLIEVRGEEALRQYRDQTRQDRFAPADIIADLEAGADAPHITQVLAEAQGYVLVPGPGLFQGEGCAFAALREASEFIAELSTSLANGGGIDRTEAPGVIREASQAAASIMGVIEELQTRFPDLTGGPVPARQRRVMITESGTCSPSSGASAPSGGAKAPARGRACGLSGRGAEAAQAVAPARSAARPKAARADARNRPSGREEGSKP